MIRHEAHFGDRVVRCFAERPRSLFEVFTDAVERNPGGEALVCGERALHLEEPRTSASRASQAALLLGVSAGASASRCCSATASSSC